VTARSKAAARAGCRINKHMRHTARDLSDDQWKVLNRLIPKPKRRSDGRGRPWKSSRSVLNGILWVLRTGAPWPTFLRHTHHFRPATVYFNNGCALE
jgi:transposase